MKNALELEDLDFVKMVDELNLKFDEVDLKDMEKNLSSKMGKVAPSSQGSSKY